MKDDIQSKLEFYKTAWSNTYQSFVEIVKVRKDDSGEPIITARVPPSDDNLPDEFVEFRICELSQFCL